MNRRFELVDKKFRTLDDVSVCLPIRGTKNSAGYDFVATKDLIIPPQETVTFKTDVKAFMQPDEMLIIDIRSSLGIKKDLMISNTLGIIDSDFYDNPDNGGNILIALRNLKPAFKILGTKPLRIGTETFWIPEIEDLQIANTVKIQAGEQVAQGIFVKFLEADNCNSDVVRGGGIGSTNA